MTPPMTLPMRAPGPRLAAALTVLLALATAGCRSAPPPAPPTVTTIDAGEGNRPYFAGTARMREDLQALIAELPSTEGEARLALGRRIVAYGEPAVPALLLALEDADPERRGAAAWLLGFLRDPRSADALTARLDDPVSHVRYEAAASLVKLGDDRGLGAIIDGLEDREAMVRAKCIILLEEVTGQDFGYRADLAPDERAAAAARWRAWAEAKAGRRME